MKRTLPKVVDLLDQTIRNKTKLMDDYNLQLKMASMGEMIALNAAISCLTISIDELTRIRYDLDIILQENNK